MRIGYTHDFKNSYGRPWKQVWEDALFLMCEAARLGFDYILVQEHFFTADGYSPAPAVFMTALIERTKDVRIGTNSYVLPLHHPAALAQEIAVLDHLSEGRLEVTAPEGASISLDGRSVGVGTWNGIVSTTGGHQLVVRKRGFQTYAVEVFVADDQVRDVNVPLNHEVSTSWVAWGVGSLLVVTGGIVAGYFAFKPADVSPYTGTLTPGITTAGANFPVKYGLHR